MTVVQGSEIYWQANIPVYLGYALVARAVTAGHNAVVPKRTKMSETSFKTIETKGVAENTAIHQTPKNMKILNRNAIQEEAIYVLWNGVWWHDNR